MVCFVDLFLYLCTFYFSHCVVCSSSIYGFWLPLWYLQTLLKKIHLEKYFQHISEIHYLLFSTHITLHRTFLETVTMNHQYKCEWRLIINTSVSDVWKSIQVCLQHQSWILEQYTVYSVISEMLCVSTWCSGYVIYVFLLIFVSILSVPDQGYSLRWCLHTYIYIYIYNTLFHW